MSRNHNKSFISGVASVAAICLIVYPAFAQTSAFTYQGKLIDGGNPANGNYDLQFALFDGGGSQIGSPLTRANTTVSAGIFTVQLDFGVNAFTGANRFLEISVRPAGSGSFTVLSPRQQISSTPYAIRTLSAANADTATNATQLGGVAANQYVQTNDSRLTDSRLPNPGSSNYIQNTTTQQNANFNILGDGTVGSNLNAGNLTVFGNSSVFANLNIAGNAQVNGITSSGGLGGVNGYVVPAPSPGDYPTIGFNTYGPSYRAGVSGYGGIFQFQNGDGQLVYYTAPKTAAGIPGTYTPRLAISTNGELGVKGTVRIGETNDHTIRLSVFAGTATAVAAVNDSAVAGDPTGYFSNSNSNGFAGAFLGKVYVTKDVGIGVLDPQRLLHVNGRARIGQIPLEASAASVCFNAAGDLLQCGASSLKWKTHIHPFHSGLNIIRHLRPISFDWKDGSGHDIGLGAEDVAKIAPSFTFTNNKGEVEGVKYERLNLVLINAMKEQQEQIERLNARLGVLEQNRRTRGRSRLR